MIQTFNINAHCLKAICNITAKNGQTMHIYLFGSMVKSYGQANCTLCLLSRCIITLNQYEMNSCRNQQTLFCLIFFQRMEYKRYQDYLLFEITHLHQNIAVIISTKCVNDPKCPFNTDSLDSKYPFNLLSSVRSYDVNRWHDKFLHFIHVKTLLAVFIQE